MRAAAATSWRAADPVRYDHDLEQAGQASSCGGSGFVEAAQLGAARDAVETDVWAFDAAGKQIFADVEYYLCHP